MPKTSTIYLRRIPRHVKDHFKALCATRGKNMTQVLIDYMRQAVQEDNEDKFPRVEDRSRRY